MQSQKKQEARLPAFSEIYERTRSEEILVHGNDFLLVIRTAVLAHHMRSHQFSACRALNKIRNSHLPVCSSLVSSCFRNFILRTNRHSLSTSLRKNHTFLIIHGSASLVNRKINHFYMFLSFSLDFFFCLINHAYGFMIISVSQLKLHGKLLQKCCRLPGNGQLFVCRNYICRHLGIFR